MSTISDLLLEQYALGELDPVMEDKVRGEIARDPVLKARYEALLSSDREILERYPPAEMARTIGERLHGKGSDAGLHGQGQKDSGMASSMEPAGRWALQLALGLPAAAVILLVFSFFMFREKLTPDVIRTKGLTPHLSAFLKTPLGARELAPDSFVTRGDLIQIGYTAGDARYGVIFSLDGRGTVTWHLPPGGSRPGRAAPGLDRQGQVMLAVSYELDDAPGFERFFFVYAEKPFDISVVAGAARALSRTLDSAQVQSLSLPAGLRQSTFLLKKRGSLQ
jgi:hypothetical protein